VSLNAEQARAVAHRGSGLLVLAGAGSGKTRVITTRIKALTDEGVPPHRILAVTFTNKAAKEMRERLAKMGVSEDVWIGTFHATGVRVLRMFAEQVGYKRNFTIYDADAQKALVKALLADVDTRGKKVADGLVLHFISHLKGEDRGPEFVEHDDSEVPRGLRKIVREVYERYEEALLRSNAMDFADLLLNTVRLLRKAKGTPAEKMLTRFDHVLVDEFQDTNKIQMEMADLFATRGELCVVGDDDQSIYGWRGADPDGMMRFAGRPGVELVKLEENYRCTSPILDCANTVIARNKKRLGKTLRANKDGELVRVSLLSSEREEARQVATSIRKPYGHHAVLYRTHAQSRPIEEALRREAIPYTIVGGLRFYDRAEVKDVLAFFRLAVNPKADMDLLRVANKPSRGMGAKKMGALKTAAAKKGVTMYEALKDLQDEKAQGLYKLLRDLAGAKHSSLGLLEFFDAVMRLTGYKAALVRTAKESSSVAQREKAQQQIENVNELASDVATYAGDNPGATVEDYIEHVSLVSSFDKESGPTVSLMTIHAAKGLEFEHVHLVGFEENLLPHANSVKAAQERGKYDEIEEERRLTYVAITRAKTRLDVTLVKMRTKAGKVERAVPSRFLAELPEGRHRKLGFKE
jgi:DNA helicase II / ATP-dependent DNA helicase PcrA